MGVLGRPSWVGACGIPASCAAAIADTVTDDPTDLLTEPAKPANREVQLFVPCGVDRLVNVDKIEYVAVKPNGPDDARWRVNVYLPAGGLTHSDHATRDSAVEELDRFVNYCELIKAGLGDRSTCSCSVCQWAKERADG